MDLKNYSLRLEEFHDKVTLNIVNIRFRSVPPKTFYFKSFTSQMLQIKSLSLTALLHVIVVSLYISF